MALVALRQFAVSPPPPGVPITNADITSSGSTSIEYPIARALRQNAYAVARSGPPTYALVQREMALVLTIFPQSRPGQPLRRDRLYDASSSHIRRFAIEAVGLGALTAAMEFVHGPTSDLAHFDVLPPTLRSVYPKAGTRPDLRFEFGCNVVAGESRARTQAASKLPRREQRTRLDELLEWSRQPACDPIAMAWTWVQPGGATVDLFELDAVRAPMPSWTWDRLRRATGADFPARWLDDEIERNAVDGDHERSAGYQQREAEAKALLVRQALDDREDELYETAPGEVVEGLARRWRGSWQQVITPDGERVARLLFAVTSSDERLPERLEPLRRRRVLARETGVEVEAAGRTLVAVDWLGDVENATEQVGLVERGLA